MTKKWWHQIIGYQIYPRSFQDSNHDGQGDIPGITAHLDDLKDLGINTLWLCPVNRSPMLDSGYDASDYDAVDPMFGNMDDMRQLIDEAQKRDIRVIMDLVVNHTSTEHPWFQAALQNPEGEYGGYYVIKEGQNGNPPNDWQAFFGGSAWEQIGETNRYYLHLFTKWQPDLNWENPKLRREIYDMINRWLDMGIAGFRVDSINHLKKNFSGETSKEDIYADFTNVEGIGTFLSELRDETYGARGAVTIGEVNGIRDDQMEAYVGENGYFSTMFDFTGMRYRIQSPEWKGRRVEMMNGFRSELMESQQKTPETVLLCNVMENHDTPRVGERFYEPEYVNFYSKSMLGAIGFFLRGIVFLYQGQTIGMTDYPKERIEQFRDFATYNLYQEYQKQGMTASEALAKLNAESREHARTPMQWGGEAYGGFSDASPWFDVNPNYREINLQVQKENEHSLYSFYKKMIALRKREDLRDIFIYGETVPCFETQDGIIAYERHLGGQSVIVLCNTNTEKTEVLPDRPITIKEQLLNNYDADEDKLGKAEKISLKPMQVLVFALSESKYRERKDGV